MTHAVRDRIQRWVLLPQPPEKVWAEIGGFGDVADWHPDVTAAEVFEIEGETHRHLTIGEGGLTLERLVETGPLHYTYEIVESPLPLANHRATLSCVAEDGGCHVFWSAMFEPTDPSADDIVTSFYEDGLRALRAKYGD
ncbi:MAG TPA: SRPBCC family protein [Thermohalobaculum sp.]|nr:SRPBCC family protein [Thermohalobaculum sp.]